MLLKNIREKIKDEISNAARDYDVDFKLKVDMHRLGDDKGTFAVPLHPLASKLNRSPKKVAEEIKEKIGDFSDLISSVESVSGFLNFHLHEKAYPQKVIDEIREEGNDFGSFKDKDELAVIDEVAPNLARPMHIGHLRNLVLSDSINKLLESQGVEVITDNHIGDWGSQFGNLAYAFERWGSEEKLEEEPIQHLLDIYKKFGKTEHQLEGEEKEEWRDKGRQWFKKLENGDERAVKLWEKMRRISEKKFEESFDLFDMEFDEWIGESFYVREGITDEVIQKALDKDIAHRRDDGGIMIKLDREDPKSEGQKEFMILKSDGSTLYSTRDLATIHYREERWDPDRILYVVASEQDQYFKDIFEIAEKLGYDRDKFYHISYGMISLPEGSMSTRRGRIVTAREVLEDVKSKALDIVSENRPELDESKKKKISEKVAHSAVRFGILRYSRHKDIVFDKESATEFEGETGPYLQYSLSRAYSILEKEPIQEESEEFKLEEKGLTLNDKLARYPLALERAADKYDPHEVAKYGFELAEEFNSFYHECPVIQAKDEDLKKSRKLLLKAFIQVMENLLKVLRIKPVKEM